MALVGQLGPGRACLLLSEARAQRCRAAASRTWGLVMAFPALLSWHWEPLLSRKEVALDGEAPLEALRAAEPPAPGDMAVLSFLLSRRHHQSHGHWEVVGQACQLGDKNELFHLGFPVWGQPLLAVQQVVDATPIAL